MSYFSTDVSEIGDASLVEKQRTDLSLRKDIN